MNTPGPDTPRALPRIILNGSAAEISGVPASTTLLDWLRDHARLRGTKEGCAEGDCGACTVMLERVDAKGVLRREAINSCLTMVGQVDGCGVRTVEGVASADGTPHPVQKAFVDLHASQCGFCTPGFIMASCAVVDGGDPSDKPTDTPAIHDALAGNLCRCTGYRSIVDALASAVRNRPAPDAERDAATVRSIAALARSASPSFQSCGMRFDAPRTLNEALALRATHREAVLLAGGTDLGLLASRRREPPAHIIHLGRVKGLDSLSESADSIVIGAGVTYGSAMRTLIIHYPALSDYLTRLGSRQIRNIGTLAGNIGTASPIGDTSPVLLALDARITVMSAARGARTIASDDFFLDYRRNALAPDELITAITLPKPSPGSLFHAEKISKRRDQDISTVCAAWRLTLSCGTVRAIRIAFGGMAATPKRARKAEAALMGKPLDDNAIRSAIAALDAEFTPQGDWRSGADYRRRVAGNLLRRLQFRITEPDTLLEVHAL